MRRILAAVLLVSLLAWAGAYWAQPPAELNIWTARDQLILLTGLGAYALMTAAHGGRTGGRAQARYALAQRVVLRPDGLCRCAEGRPAPGAACR